ncbi:hypothetical protein F4861DRAFT_39842 [Xylaria intraflava]|nr:hypothetical protein F4861DRAFT_39842 [Xylaria intraflava]
MMGWSARHVMCIVALMSRLCHSHRRQYEETSRQDRSTGCHMGTDQRTRSLISRGSTDPVTIMRSVRRRKARKGGEVGGRDKRQGSCVPDCREKKADTFTFRYSIAGASVLYVPHMSWSIPPELRKGSRYTLRTQ